jgi:hypothetical protein
MRCASTSASRRSEPEKPPRLRRGDPLRGCLRESGLNLFARELSKMLPNQNHPLTRAYMLGARATSPQAMTDAMRLIAACEGAADQLTIDQCKLAAEVLIERKMP